VGAASIATFVPKDRALSPLEIRLMARQMESVATYPTIRLALRMILLTLVRKSELIQATWDEVDFENATWTIPKQRMKGATRTWSICRARRSTSSWRCTPARPAPSSCCRRATTPTAACRMRP
jgi:integrase